jgi:chemotaxis response regulator CheB
MLVEILSRITTIPVVEAKDGIKVEPNTIYIRPSNV